MKTASIIVAACGIGIGANVHAQSVFNPNLGSWHTAANWSPFGVPVAGSTAIISGSPGRETIISSDDASALWIRIGDQSGETGTLNISNGRMLTVGGGNSGQISVGREGGVGNLFVSDGGRINTVSLDLGENTFNAPTPGHGTAVFSGAGTRVDSKLIIVGASNGRGDMLIRDGADVEVAVFGTFVAVLTPQGFSSTLSVTDPGSRLSTPGLTVGGHGSGILSIDNGGRVDAGFVTLGAFAQNPDVPSLIEGVGLLNLNGADGARGLLETRFIRKGNDWGDPIGSGSVRFDGGILFTTEAGELFRNFETGDVQIASGGAFFDGSASGTIGLGMQGLGGLTKNGNHTLQLAGPNTYQGNTDIRAGRLMVDGSLQGSGIVTAQSGGTLAGNGFIAGDVVIGSFGRIAAGGTLSTEAPGELFLLGDMEWQGGSTYRWAINNATGQMGGEDGWGHLQLDGALTITADADNPFTVNLRTLDAANAFGAISNWDPNLDQQWTILTALGGINGFDPSAAVVFDFNFFAVNADVGGYFWLSTLEIPGGPAGGGETRMILHYTVPTPGTLGVLALAGLAATRRRRA